MQASGAGFDPAWLLSVTETLLLTPEWRKVQDSVAASLRIWAAANVGHPLTREALMESLGPVLRDAVFPGLVPMPHTLEEPYVQVQVRKAEAERITTATIRHALKVISTSDFAESHAEFAERLADIVLSGLAWECRNCHLDLTRTPSEVIGAGLAQMLVSTGDGGLSTLIPGLPRIIRNASLLSEVVVKFRGKSLPSTLRPVIWRTVLCPETQVLQVQKALADVVNRTKVSDPCTSVLHSLLSRVVDKAHRAELQPLVGPAHGDASIKVLNAYFNFCGDHNPVHVALLVPLLHVFPSATPGGGGLETMLHVLCTRCFAGITSPKACQHLADELMTRVQQELPDVHAHFVQCSISKHARKEMSASMAKFPSAARLSASNIDDAPAEPAVPHIDSATAFQLLERLVSTGMVAQLRPTTLLFVWDQCCLDGWWDHGTYMDLMLCVLELVGPALAECRSVAQARRVLTNETRDIYTTELQAAYRRRLARMVASEPVPAATVPLEPVRPARRASNPGVDMTTRIRRASNAGQPMGPGAPAITVSASQAPIPTDLAGAAPGTVQ